MLRGGWGVNMGITVGNHVGIQGSGFRIEGSEFRVRV